MNNKYIKRSRISEKKFREILRYFSLDIEAKKTSELTRISRPTINKIYAQIRERPAEKCEGENPLGKEKLRWTKVILEREE
jgi:CRISPR/Cas system CSM-associated protein Csm2 small subunit